MAKIQGNKSRGNVSFRVTLPRDKAEQYIEKYGKEIEVIEWGEGFKLQPPTKE